MLEENASVARRLAVRARRAGQTSWAERHLARAEESAQQAAAIRQMIVNFDDAGAHIVKD